MRKILSVTPNPLTENMKEFAMTTEPPNGILRTVAKTKPRKTRSEPYDGQRLWLAEAEIERLMANARKHGRYGHRDATMILLAYRHGLRASEIVSLTWNDIDWER